MTDPSEDYKLKLDYLKSQFDRLLTRFNYFLSVEVALFGFLGFLLFQRDSDDNINIGENIPATILPAALGLFVSLLWYIVAAADRALVQAYRQRAEDSKYVQEHPAKEVEDQWNSPLSWYWSPLSVTRIPVWVAFLTYLFWLIWLIWLVTGALFLDPKPPSGNWQFGALGVAVVGLIVAAVVIWRTRTSAK